MTQEAQPDTQSVLTPEVKAMIGVEGELIESWGTVDVEYLRRFTQAVMDPDPRYWDEDFAKSTHYGAIIVPPIMVSYMTQRIRPEAEDAITAAFKENPMSDGIGSVKRPGELPEIPNHPGDHLHEPEQGPALYHQTVLNPTLNPIKPIIKTP